MLLNVDTDRFLSTIKEIPEASMVNDIQRYTDENRGISDSFAMFAMSTLEHISSDGALIYGGMVFVDGWDMGRPEKRRLDSRTTNQMKTKTYNTTTIKAVSIFETLMCNDPDRECIWAITIHVSDPVTKNNTSQTDHMCLFLVDQAGRLMEYDPLGSVSPVKVVANLAFAALKNAFLEVMKPATLIPDNEDISMIRMPRSSHQSALWCVYVSFHRANGTLGDVKALNMDELYKDFHDFVVVFPQHVAAAIVVLFHHTSKILNEATE